MSTHHAAMSRHQRHEYFLNRYAISCAHSFTPPKESLVGVLPSSASRFVVVNAPAPPPSSPPPEMDWMKTRTRTRRQRRGNWRKRRRRLQRRTRTRWPLLLLVGGRGRAAGTGDGARGCALRRSRTWDKKKKERRVCITLLVDCHNSLGLKEQGYH